MVFKVIQFTIFIFKKIVMKQTIVPIDFHKITIKLFVLKNSYIECHYAYNTCK